MMAQGVELDPVEQITDLMLLRKRIREHHENAEAFKGQTLDLARKAIMEVCLAGQALKRVKELLPWGAWLKWLKQHCSEISDQTARNYMRVANSKTFLNLESYSGVCAVYQAIGLLPERTMGEGEERTAAGIDLQALKRWGGWLRNKMPDPAVVLAWSDEEKEAARAVLEPAAALYASLAGGAPPVKESLTPQAPVCG